MKKFLFSLLTAVMLLSLTACTSKQNAEGNSSAIPNNNGTAVNAEDADKRNEANTEEEVNAETIASNYENAKPEMVAVNTLNGQSESVELVVPYDPQKIVVLDMAVLDIIDILGLGDRVVGVADSSNVEYLKGYMEKDGVVNVGTVKEVDLEKIMACEPDVIFIGGRLAASYDALSEIAPVIYLTTDTELGVVESTRKNANSIASIFGKEAEADAMFADFDARIEALKEIAAGKTAVIGMCTNGGFNLLGNNGRCSIIGVEIGFDNLGNDAAGASLEKGGNGEKAKGEDSKGSDSNSSAHGNESSFELVVALKPDYIFVMDRDAAIATNGAKLAKEIMENELIVNTDAYKNGNLVILEHPGVWYLAEGGVNALNIMITDLENALLK